MENQIKLPLLAEITEVEDQSKLQELSAATVEPNNTATGQEHLLPLTQPVPDSNPPQATMKIQASFWRDKVKTGTANLDPVETPVTLASGEACVHIPNSVIKKNRKSWDSFIIGQFYEEAPARGAVHAITNGMWSK